MEKPLGREMSSGFMGKHLKEALPPTVDAGAGLVNIQALEKSAHLARYPLCRYRDAPICNA
jgi:hypothetical protein